MCSPRPCIGIGDYRTCPTADKRAAHTSACWLREAQVMNLMAPHVLMAAMLSGSIGLESPALTMRSGVPQLLPAQHQPRPATAPQQETQQDRMRRRFPQPVRVGDLIGLRVVDDNDATIGVVRQAARTPEGRILLIVAHTGVLRWGGRLVAVPIEAVGIFGRQLAKYSDRFDRH